MRRNVGALFTGESITDIIRSQQYKLDEEIANYGADQLLSAGMEGLLDYLEKKYELDVPQLHEDLIDVAVDDRSQIVRGPFESYRQTGTGFTYHVPYSGSQGFFQVQPTTLSVNPPRGFATDTELLLTFECWGDADRSSVKGEAERLLQQIRASLDQQRLDVAGFQEDLRGRIRTRIESRRAKLLADRNVAASLGFPVRAREGAARTYAVPIEQKRKLVPRPPSISGDAFKPEPAMDTEAYERALQTCANLALIVEQSPTTFAAVTETFIRDVLLMMLNDQFSGPTRETFRAAGKIDVLIEVEGRAIFIAECKFYDGPRSIGEALDQLLSYTTWRDTKLALVVFSRLKDFTQVLRRIDESVRGYGQFKSSIKYASETGFRYVLTRKDDVNREMHLTVLAFAIPTT